MNWSLTSRIGDKNLKLEVFNRCSTKRVLKRKRPTQMQLKGHLQRMLPTFIFQISDNRLTERFKSDFESFFFTIYLQFIYSYLQAGNVERRSNAPTKIFLIQNFYREHSRARNENYRICT